MMKNANEYMKDHTNYLNCGKRYEDIIIAIIHTTGIIMSSTLSPQFKYVIFHIFICKTVYCTCFMTSMSIRHLRKAMYNKSGL